MGTELALVILIIGRSPRVRIPTLLACLLATTDPTCTHVPSSTPPSNHPLVPSLRSTFLLSLSVLTDTRPGRPRHFHGLAWAVISQLQLSILHMSVACHQPATVLSHNLLGAGLLYALLICFSTCTHVSTIRWTASVVSEMKRFIVSALAVSSSVLTPAHVSSMSASQQLAKVLSHALLAADLLYSSALPPARFTNFDACVLIDASSDLTVSPPTE